MSVPENTADELAAPPRRRKFRISCISVSAKWLAWPESSPTCCDSGRRSFLPWVPRNREPGHRLYRRKEVEMVLEIKRLLYEKRFTIEGARKFLETRGKAEPAQNGQSGEAGKESAKRNCSRPARR